MKKYFETIRAGVRDTGRLNENIGIRIVKEDV